MTSDAKTPDEYVAKLPYERKTVISKLRDIIRTNLPKGFEECISYKMIGFVVPHAIFPAGYHVDPKLPLPFINIASQKNFVALYHSGIYADRKLFHWFTSEYPKHCKRKLNMGKSCVRFKYLDDIPYELIKELCTKMTPEDWVKLYEKRLKK
ncbi:MAG: hypothetical protein COA50_01325 [Flavobacteriaceae bacterium]|nr:MAG: hypothetical protein COA50_01325 [Flavobacteriaceae bacterium]